MSKINLLITAVISLIIINLCLLAVLFLYPQKAAQKPLHPTNDEPKNIIIQKLNFDAAQIKAYQHLIDTHRQNVRTYNDEIRETKNELYLTLNQSKPSQSEELLNKLAQLQKEIEQVHYNHFADIKKLCKPNQLAAFNDLTQELADIFTKGKERKNPPPPPPNQF